LLKFNEHYPQIVTAFRANLRSRPQEDQSRAKGAVGEGSGWEEVAACAVPS